MLYNLNNLHSVLNNEEALLLLLIVNDNKLEAKTPKNNTITRKNYIFMIELEATT